MKMKIAKPILWNGEEKKVGDIVDVIEEIIQHYKRLGILADIEENKIDEKKNTKKGDK